VATLEQKQSEGEAEAHMIPVYYADSIAVLAASDSA